MRHELPIETLHALLRLDPETGRLFWRERGAEWCPSESERKRWNARFAGRLAFATPTPKGYFQGKILGRYYRAHRVVFAMTHGRWPDGEVDHKDTVEGNNAPANLRPATRRQQCHNRGSVRGTSRFCGVSWNRADRVWRAFCCDAGGKNHYLGRFADEAAAARAYDAFAAQHHGEFARLNFGAFGDGATA